MASESSFLPSPSSSSRGRTPSTSSGSSSSSNSSDGGNAEHGDGLPTYRSAVESRGREEENGGLKPFVYERRGVVQVLREVEGGSASGSDDDDDGLEGEGGRGGRRRFWR